MRPFAAVVAIGLLLVAIALRAQQAPLAPQATFRAGVEVVDVDVSVLDKHRLPVRDLTASDFAVLEDGKARPIVAFTSVDLPTRELPSAPWMAEIAPDVQTNEFPREGRLVVILMDRSIAPDQYPTARRVAEAAVDQLRPGDLAAVVYSAFGIPQNFTADRRRLLAAIRQPLAGLPEDDSGEAGECYCRACTLETITKVSEAIEDVRQRRKMLFFVGSNIAIQSTGPCSGVLAAARRRAMEAAEAGNITVYAFDPSGLQTLATPASAAGGPGRPPAMANIVRQGNLMILPDHTGGRMVAGNRPDGTLPEIFRESNSYYVLGFHPAHADGKFHDIKVRVGRRDVILQARRGYWAAGGKPRATVPVPKGVPPILHGAIAGLWPATDLPLSLSAVPVAMPGMRTATVALVVQVEQRLVRSGASSMPVAEAIAPAHETLVHVMVGAYDRNGVPYGYERQTVSVTPRRAGGQPLSYEVIAHLELKPGRYEIRAAVEDTALGQAGSVYTYVDVPDFFKELVSLSGIFLHAEPSGASTANAALRELLPAVPTARRQFTRGDNVTAFLQVYQGVRRPAMPGYVTAEIRGENDRRVFRQETRTLTEDVGANRATNLSFDLPMRTLERGQYLLTIEVRHGNATATRELRFSMQ